MKIDTSILLWGLVFSSIGFVYFRYGKKQSNYPVRYSGVALMIYPYFMHNVLSLILLGIGLMLLPKIISY